MKILIAADVLGEENNGTTIAATNLINALKDRGHEVRVLCCDDDKKDWPGYYILPKMNFGPFNNYVAKNGVVPAKADAKVFLKALKDVDLVHIMLPFAASNKLVTIANKHNIPISAGFHCQAENFTSHIFLMWSHLANRLTYKHFWRHCYHSVDCIHYPTEFIKNDFEKVVGPTNAYIISNGVKPFFHHIEGVEKPEQFKDKFCIVMSGRYSPEKRQDILIKAVKYSKYKDKIQLIFAGDGQTKKKLMRMSKKLPNYPFFGYHKKEELLQILNYSDLYVHSAYAELESISALESMHCGLVPIINKSKRSATKFFALDDLNLFKQNDPKDLAKKIDFWIDHPKERKIRSEQYIEYTKRFDFDHCMDRMEKMMFEAVDVREYKIEHNLHHRIVYYKDPLNDDFAGTEISQKKVDDNFVYVHENKLWRLCGTIFYYGIAYPLIFALAIIKRHVRVKNKKILKKVKGKGYFLYGNHTNIYDAFIPHVQVSRFKKTYIIANPDAVSIKGVKNLVMMLGALPTPSSPNSVKNFNAAIEKRINQKRVIVIYPEAHIWPFYNGLRPFSDISFQYPAKLGAPVIAMVTTYRKPKRKIQKKRRPFIDITLSEPIYPNPELSQRENMKYLRDQVYNFMKKTIEESGSPEYINYVQAKPDSTKFEN